jgi:hypothetical protein
MAKLSTAQSIKLLWIAGFAVWFPMIAILWRRVYEAQTLSQASLNMKRLVVIDAVGLVWFLAGRAWLAKLKKMRTT